jgi:hypothetical protein
VLVTFIFACSEVMPFLLHCWFKICVSIAI